MTPSSALTWLCHAVEKSAEIINLQPWELWASQQQEKATSQERPLQHMEQHWEVRGTGKNWG